VTGSASGSSATAGVIGSASGVSAAPLERVTVNLVPRASAALAATVARTGDSKTDVVNQAVKVYELLGALQDAGNVIYIRNPGSQELERLRIL
jgi:hypothetical protein